MPCIDQATLDDIPQLCGLLTLLFTQEADFQADLAKQSAGLAQIINQPEAGQILVLRNGATITGMVNLLYTISTACGGRVGILEDMVIHPEQRGSGAGTQLLQEAIAFAQANGCLRLTLLTDRSNEAAIRFYQRQGFNLSEMVPLRLNFPDQA